MGYNALVKTHVRNAFNLIGDLAIDITLSQSTPTGYNFNTKTLENNSATVTTVKAVREYIEREPSDNTIKVKLIMIADDIINPKIYDTVTFDGQTWTIIPPYEDNGYTITIYASQEK